MKQLSIECSEHDSVWISLWLDQNIDGLAIALEGSLGAGKSSLVRHFLRTVGIEGAIKSPTYTLCEYYYPIGRLPVLHIDAYRLQDEDAWHVAGLDLWENRGSTRFVEWCSLAPEQFAACDVVIDINAPMHGNTRIYTLTSQSIKGAQWLSSYIGPVK